MIQLKKEYDVSENIFMKENEASLGIRTFCMYRVGNILICRYAIPRSVLSLDFIYSLAVLLLVSVPSSRDETKAFAQ